MDYYIYYIIQFIIELFTFSYSGQDVVLASLLGAAAILGGASLLGSVFSSEFANRTNTRNARAANDLQYRMFNESNQFNRQERLETQEWNRRMWYEQQRYNSPAQQYQRLLAAGLNPGALMSGDSAGVSGSIPASQPASSASPPSVQVPQISPLFTAQDMSQISSSLLGMAETQGKLIDNQTLMDRNIAELQKTQGELRKQMDEHGISEQTLKNLQQQYHQNEVHLSMLEYQRDRQGVLADQNDQLYKLNVQKYMDEHNMSTIRYKAEKLAYDIQAKYGMNMADRQLAQLEVGIREASSRIGLLNAQRNMTQQQVKNLIAEESKTIAEKLGVDEQNKHFKEIRADLEQQIYNQTVLHQEEADQAAYNNYLYRNSKPYRVITNTLDYVGKRVNRAIHFK